MIKFICSTCGESVEENLLPGKHAVAGAARMLDEKKECCSNPQYFDSMGVREGLVKPSLRDMLPSLSA